VVPRSDQHAMHQFCGEHLAPGYFSKTWKDTHYRTYHLEYSEWLDRWIKNFVIVGTVDVAILGAALYFLYNPLTLIAAGLLYSVPLYILMIRYSRRVSQFKREWREQHPSLTPA